MIRSLPFALGALLVVVAVLGWRRRRPSPFPAALAPLLHIPLRGLVLRPDRVVAQLGLAPDMRVLEVGPGTGYVTREVARRLGQGGTVVGLDIQVGMLRALRARVASAVPVCASGSALPFRSDSFDRVYLVSVLGEIPDKEEALREYARVLRAGGVLAVTEAFYDPDFVRLGTLAALAERAGFVAGARDGTRAHYTHTLTRV